MTHDAVAQPAVVTQLVGRALADHAEPVRVVDVQERVVLERQALEAAHIRCVAGHRVHAVHRDDPGRPAVLAQELRQVLLVVVPEPDHLGPSAGGEHRAVEDRLVRAAVEEDRALAGEDRDHRHVDVRDRREQQHVLGAEELGHLLFDLDVGLRAPEQPRPRGVRSPARDVLGHRVDHLGVEVQPEVIARREVRQPVIADPDAAADLFVDHRVHHRMGVLQPGQVRCGRHPTVQPSIARTSPLCTCLQLRQLVDLGQACSIGGRVAKSHTARISAGPQRPLREPGRCTRYRVVAGD